MGGGGGAASNPTPGNPTPSNPTPSNPAPGITAPAGRTPTPSEGPFSMPAGSAERAEADGGAAGWTEASDGEGHVYYYNLETGETSW